MEERKEDSSRGRWQFPVPDTKYIYSSDPNLVKCKYAHVIIRILHRYNLLDAYT